MFNEQLSIYLLLVIKLYGFVLYLNAPLAIML